MVESPTAVFVGRQSELNQLIDSLYNEKRSVTILSSESGMGKSALLSRLYGELKEKERGSSSSSFLVGFYDRDKALVGGSTSMIYPFAIVLKSLLEWLNDTTDYSDEFRTLIKRTQGALIKTLREEGSNILVALIDDVAKKFGFDQTLDVVKKFYKNFKEQKTSVALAAQYVAENQQEAIIAYMTILKSLASEFVDRKFVFIFDQFEMVRKASIDFLINFVATMPDNNFHVIVSFRVEEKEWSDSVARQLYEYASDHLTDHGARNITLEGLTAEEIGEWIKAVRKVELPTKDLQIIRERSGGFPILLNDWITRPSSKLDYNEINRDRYCGLVQQRFKRLSREDEKIKLNKLSILQYSHPFEAEQMAHFLEIDLDHLQLFIDEAISIGIFEKRGEYDWFRHELAQYCISSNLLPRIKKAHHKYAADFYLEQLNTTSSSDMGNEGGIAVKTAVIGCAFHLHEAGMFEESVTFNKYVGQRASNIGDLDLAERCYLRAIDDASNIKSNDELVDCSLDLIHNVIVPWGRYDEAYKKYYELLQKYRDYFSSMSNRRSLVLSYMAQIDYIKKDYDKAKDLYDESLSIATSLNNQTAIAEISHGIAMIYYDNKKYDEATEYFEISRFMADNIGNKLGVILSSYYIAEIYRIKKDYDKAMNIFNDDLQVAKEIGNKSSIAQILHGIANVHYDKGEYDEAIKVSKKRLSIENEIGHRSGISVTLLDIGKTLIKKRKYKEALPYTLKAKSMLDELNIPDKEDAHDALRFIQRELGDSEYQMMMKGEMNYDDTVS